MNVIEQDRDGREVLTSRSFFIHDLKYIEESNRWVYQLNK